MQNGDDNYPRMTPKDATQVLKYNIEHMSPEAQRGAEYVCVWVHDLKRYLTDAQLVEILTNQSDLMMGEIK